MSNDDEEIRTVFCGNLSEDVTDGILYELFNQAGPVESVRRPKDPSGRPKSFGFIVFKHKSSVPYAIELFKCTKLFNRNINVNTRNTYLYHIPVLDTHLTEFTELENRSDLSRSQRPHISERDHRNNVNQRSDFYRSKVEEDRNKASSWAELKNSPLQPNRFVSNCLDGDVLRNSFIHKSYSNATHHVTPDFNALLQMGQQMIMPGLMGLHGITGVPNMIPLMGLGPTSLGNSMFPSMQGRMSGGEWHSPPQERWRRDYEDRERRGHNGDRERRGYYGDRERRDCREERESGRDNHRGRESRRDHPYDDRHRNHWEDHKHHDRGYSSSRSSHERERRDRRSR